MSFVVAFQNNKGGVGKTFLSVNLAGVIAEQGCDVLLVDLDEQGDSTKLVLGSGVDDSVKTARDLLLSDACSVHNLVLQTQLDHIYIIAGGKYLKGLDTAISLDQDAPFRCRERIRLLAVDFDTIIFDLPTPLSGSVRSAFAATDLVVIPTQPEMTSIINSAGTERLIGSVQRYMNPGLILGGYVLNLCKPSSAFNEPVIQRQHIDFLKIHLREKLLKTVVYNYVVYQEARASGLPISHFAPNSAQAQVFRDLYEEICHVRKGALA